MTTQTAPRLRPLEIKRFEYQGRWYFHLRDQLELSGQDLLVPVEFGPALALMDGQHDLAMIRTRALLLHGLDLAPTDLIELIERLEAACLLEGPGLDAAMAGALAAYHAQPHRPPALADRAYPGAADDLRAQLLAFEMGVDTRPLPAEQVAGVLSPHIDYARGGPVYASGWRQAAAAARAAKTAIVLGTDHAGSGGRLTLSRRDYATPWGVLETDRRLCDALAEALGPEEAYREELHHRREHSIELATVWLHHVRGGQPLELLPILCGHPGPLLNARAPAGVEGLDLALAILREAVAQGALVVVAGDLAHVGPAFGDPQPFGAAERAAVQAADEALIAACSGGCTPALGEVAAIDDRYRICGLTPLAVALAIMPPVHLEVAAYDQCPADAEGASFVSIAAGCFLRSPATAPGSSDAASLRR
jgi:AmmeMemoRadiSam system protein B